MKKILLLLFLLPFVACNALKTPVIYEAYAVDYSRYTDKGFYVSESMNVMFDYQSIGSLSADFYSGYDPILVKGEYVYVEDMNGHKVKQTSSKYIVATPQGVMDLLYEKALGMGANGIINLKINFQKQVNPETLLDQYGYTGSAIAIKK